MMFVTGVDHVVEPRAAEAAGARPDVTEGLPDARLDRAAGCTSVAGLAPGRAARPDGRIRPGRRAYPRRVAQLPRSGGRQWHSISAARARRDLVPVSDGAGEVTSVGAGVTARRGRRSRRRHVLSAGRRTGPGRGARLAARRHAQPTTPCSTRAALSAIPDGSLTRTRRVCRAPASRRGMRSFAPAARFAPGDTVLVLGTGGVSMLGAAAGPRRRRARHGHLVERREAGAALALGASRTAINYARTPEWDNEVLRLTGGRGVDCVVEIGGAGTFARSIQSLARGGKMCLIGFLAGPQGDTARSADDEGGEPARHLRRRSRDVRGDAPRGRPSTASAGRRSCASRSRRRPQALRASGLRRSSSARSSFRCSVRLQPDRAGLVRRTAA